MFAAALEAGRETQDVHFGEALVRKDRRHRRTSFCQGAGLVQNEGVDLLETLERLGVLDQDAGVRTTPHPDHDRDRRGQAQRTGTGDDEHRNGGDQGVGQTGFGTDQAPDDSGEQGDRDHRGDEPARDCIGQPLDRGATALGLGHHLDDLRQQGVRAHLVGAHDKGSGLVERAGHDPVADLLGHRHGLAGHHGFIDSDPAIQKFAIDRDLLSGSDPQAVADGDLVKRDIFIDTIRADPACGLGREVQQGADRARGLFAGAQFQNLADEDQHGDDRRRLEIDRRASVGLEEGGRKQGWRDDGHDAVEPRHADPHGDQGEHIQPAGAQRCPAALEEGPAAPENDGGRQRELDPVRHLARDEHVKIGQVPAHLQGENRQGQDQADPEAAGEVDQFVVRRRFRRDRFRFEGHAADRAGAWALLPDLGVHRAGVDGAGNGRLGLHARIQITRRIADELGPASSRAEEIVLTVMAGAVSGGRRID